MNGHDAFTGHSTFRPARIATAVGLMAVILVSGCGPASAGDAHAAVDERQAPGVMTPVAMTTTAQQQLPPEVGRWVQSVRRECVEAGGRWVGISDFVLPGDFNGDGRTDYLLLREGANCPGPGGGALGALERLWGNAGPTRDFVISQGGGGYRVYDGFSRVPELDLSNIVRRGDRDVVVVDGTWREPGGEVHRVFWGWTGQGVGVVERQDANGRSVNEEGYPVRAASTNGPSAGFTVNVSLSAQATARLRGRESIVVSVHYYGNPKPGREEDSDMGIDLGSEQARGEGRSGSIRISGDSFRSERLALIAGRPFVNVNFFTSRSSSPDNLIGCEPSILSGDLAEIAGRVHEVRCALISEG